MKSKDEAVHELVAYHFEVEPHLVRVYRFRSENEREVDEPIKLLEVNDATFPTGSIEPFVFGPSDEIPYTTVIAEVTQQELETLRGDEKAWPDGWNLALAEVVLERKVA